MDAGRAGAGGVEDDAGEGMDVIGETGASVSGERGRDGGRPRRSWSGLIGFAGGEDGETEGGELKSQAIGQGEGDVFLEELLASAGGDTGARVIAAVGGVKENHGVIEGWPGSGASGDGLLGRGA